MANLIKSHRAIGIERGRTETHVIIETSPEPGHTLALEIFKTQPATAADVLLQFCIELAEIVEKANFLGASNEQLVNIIAKEILTK